MFFIETLSTISTPEPEVVGGFDRSNHCKLLEAYSTPNLQRQQDVNIRAASSFSEGVRNYHSLRLNSLTKIGPCSVSR